MLNSRMLEVSVGLFVAVGIAALLVLAINVSNVSNFSSDGYYTITANFENVSGLKKRSSVAIAGVNVGRVLDISVDPVTYEAIVTMSIDKRFNEVPVDSSVAIYTAGLLGEKYIGIEPGGAPDYLEQDSVIHLAQSSIVLEKLISQFLFSQSNSTKK